MSRVKATSEMTVEQQKILKQRGTVTPRSTDWVPYPQPIYLYSNDSHGQTWVPYALGDDVGCTRRASSDFELNQFKATKSLLTSETDPHKQGRDQTVAYSELFNRLKSKGHAFGHISTGYGKSALMVHLAAKMRRGKRMVLVYSQDLQKQNAESFKEFSDARVQLIKGKKKDPDAHVYVLGLKKAALQPPEFFNDVSFLIIDEVDQLPAKTLIEVMKKVRPAYLLGLTATVNRDDNLHQALYAYFGPRNEFISRFIRKRFDVIKYQTSYKPEIEYGNNGRPLDNILTDSIAYNVQRQEAICDLVEMYVTDKILILSKRIGEIEALNRILVERGVDVDYKHTRKPKWDVSRRVLIGGYQSCGRGLDIKGLSVLISVSAVNHIEQNEGRLRKSGGVIIDFVDNHPIFDNRWEKRRRWYKKRGATLFFQVHGSSTVRHLK